VYSLVNLQVKRGTNVIIVKVIVSYVTIVATVLEIENFS